MFGPFNVHLPGREEPSPYVKATPLSLGSSGGIFRKAWFLSDVILKFFDNKEFFQRYPKEDLVHFRQLRSWIPQRTTSDLELQTWERARRRRRGERVGLLGSSQRPQGFSCQTQLDFCLQLFGLAPVDNCLSATVRSSVVIRLCCLLLGSLQELLHVL